MIPAPDSLSWHRVVLPAVGGTLERMVQPWLERCRAGEALRIEARTTVENNKWLTRMCNCAILLDIRSYKVRSESPREL